MKKLICLAVTTFFALSFAQAVAQDAARQNGDTAQPTPSPAATVREDRLTIETRDKETPAMRGLRVEGNPQRRLPDGFGPLVNSTQREEIYKIQADYHELIALLQLRVDLLTQERNAKIEGVLTPAQFERLTPSQLERLRPARLAPIRNLLGR